MVLIPKNCFCLSHALKDLPIFFLVIYFTFFLLGFALTIATKEFWSCKWSFRNLFARLYVTSLSSNPICLPIHTRMSYYCLVHLVFVIILKAFWNDHAWAGRFHRGFVLGHHDNLFSPLFSNFVILCVPLCSTLLKHISCLDTKPLSNRKSSVASDGFQRETCTHTPKIHCLSL